MGAPNHSKELPRSSEELSRLLRLMCEDRLTSQDVETLQSLLSGSEDARWEYIYTNHMLADVKRWAESEKRVLDGFGDGDVGEVVRETRGEFLSDAVGVMQLFGARSDGESGHTWGARRNQPSSSTGGVRQNKRRWTLLLTFAAALCLISVGLVALRSDIREGATVALPVADNHTTRASALSDSQSVVARIVSTTSDIKWADGSRPSDFLMRLRPGDSVKTQSGRVTIEFCDGAFLVLHSPALLQVTSGGSARLLYGRVAGRAEQGNFVLLTPQATVVDIGTEFGVNVTNGNTDVSVFEGEVDVYGQMKLAHNSSVRLTRGMSASIDPNGRTTKTDRPQDARFSRDFFQHEPFDPRARQISLLDLLNGYDNFHSGIAGSIDPVTGYWGKVPHETEDVIARRGDTQFTCTTWNRFVDGVFVPRANAREMQINSDGQMVYLPPNSGTTWGPIWARRRTEMDATTSVGIEDHENWGGGTLAPVRERLSITRDGLIGFHANAGITFDLAAVREVCSKPIEFVSGTIVNLDSSGSYAADEPGSLADFRVFVDGKLRFSRLGFGRKDGDASLVIPITDGDRFLTLVTTDADGNPSCDHVVVVDPVIELQF